MSGEVLLGASLGFGSVLLWVGWALGRTGKIGDKVVLDLKEHLKRTNRVSEFTKERC